MTVGTPCVEREKGSKHTETDEDKREEDVLHVVGDSHAGKGVVTGDIHHVHR